MNSLHAHQCASTIWYFVLQVCCKKTAEKVVAKTTKEPMFFVSIYIESVPCVLTTLNMALPNMVLVSVLQWIVSV